MLWDSKVGENRLSGWEKRGWEDVSTLAMPLSRSEVLQGQTEQRPLALYGWTMVPGSQPWDPCPCGRHRQVQPQGYIPRAWGTSLGLLSIPRHPPVCPYWALSQLQTDPLPPQLGLESAPTSPVDGPGAPRPGTWPPFLLPGWVMPISEPQPRG